MRLSYAPQTTFVVSIVVGLLLAGLVGVLAVVLLVGSRRAARGVARDDAPSALAAAVAPSRSRRGARAAHAGRVLALVTLAVVSVPLAAGAVVGRVTRHASLSTAAAVGLGALTLAGLLVTTGSSATAVPVGSDVVTAVVLGLLAGRVLGDLDRSDEVGAA